MVHTKTRRVIYVDDESWKTIRTQAERRGLSISAWIREKMTKEEASTSVSIGEVKRRPTVDLAGYGTKPFTPVPKKGTK